MVSWICTEINECMIMNIPINEYEFNTILSRSAHGSREEQELQKLEAKMRQLQNLLLQEIWRKTEKENENESWQKLVMHSRKHHRSIISMHACWTKSNRPCFCRHNLDRYWPFCISFSIREAPPSSTLSLSTFLKFVVIFYLTRVLAPWNLRLLLSVI